MGVKGTSLELDIGNPDKHYVGGDTLSGRAVFSVSESRGISIREISLRLVCDIDVSIADRDRPQAGQSSNRQTRKMRLHEEEFPVYLEYGNLKQGIHAIPFQFVLPTRTPALPPSVTSVVSEQTYGNINYFVEAKVKRSSWIFNSDIKAKAHFLFLPAYMVSQPEPLHSPSQEIEFTSYMGGSAEKPRGIRKLLAGKSHRKSAPLALNCIMKIPNEGLRQDRPTKFGLVISSGNSEVIMAKYLTLTIETVLVMETGNSAIETVVNSLTLVHQMILKSGSVLDLSNYMDKVRPNQLILPTFKTPIMSHYHRVNLKCMITRNMDNNLGETMHISENIPIVVLSPQTRPKSPTGSVVQHERTNSAASDTSFTNPSTYGSRKHKSEYIAEQHQERPRSHEPISPTYSGSPYSTTGHEDIKASPPPYDAI